MFASRIELKLNAELDDEISKGAGAMTATTREQHVSDPDAGVFEDLVSIDPITSLSSLHKALNNGHAVLAGAALPGDAPTCAAPTSSDPREGTAHAPAMSSDAAADHFDRFASLTRHLDRLRALELVHLASAVLFLGFRSETSRTALDDLFPSEDYQETTAGATSQGTAVGAGDPTSFPGAAGADTESFCNHAEFVLTTADETAIAASLDSRTGLARKHIGHALTAYIGTPLLLRAILEGRLRFNRWESFIRRFAWLPLASLRAVDVFITTLDTRISLHQFMRRVSQFIATLTEKPVLAARASQGRSAWVEDLPGGQSILCAKGPTPLVHAHFNEGLALARALVKNQTESLDVTHVEKEPSEDESTGEDEAGTLDQSEDCSADASSASSTAPASANSGTAGSAANDGEGSAASLDEGVADDAFEDLPPLKSLSLDEQRMIQQLTFDTLITARPRTETVLEHATPGTEETDRYRVQVSLPDQATVLRKHATVVVTVPATTLLGLDNRPGMIADCPIPADMARTIAAGSTVWYRMLTDPSTGRVLDHVAHKYEPDRATRMSVMSKWQTCTAPGCSRPARHCDIDHGIPFNHRHPEQGGRTEPANLHPLCRRHHQAKTEGHLRMRRITADEIEWIMPLGTTSTTAAPVVDAGGVISAACTPEDTPHRAAARRTLADHQRHGADVSSPSEYAQLTTAASSSADDACDAQAEDGTTQDRITPDEALARVWAEHLDSQKRWDEEVLRARERQRNARAEERQRFQAWKDDQVAILQSREEEISRRLLHVMRVRDQLRAERTRLAVHRSAIWKHNKQCGAVLPAHIPVGSYDLTSSRIEWKTTIVPTHVETFAPRDMPAHSVHIPLEPVRVTGPLAMAVIDAASQGAASYGRKSTGATSGREATRTVRGDESARMSLPVRSVPSDQNDRSTQSDQAGRASQPGSSEQRDGNSSERDPQNDPPPF